jgi:hypothetical protein
VHQLSIRKPLMEKAIRAEKVVNATSVKYCSSSVMTFWRDSLRFPSRSPPFEILPDWSPYLLWLLWPGRGESRMNEIQPYRSANLANLVDALKTAECDGSLHSIDSGLENARNALIEALNRYQRTHYELGCALWDYKTHFKAEHQWTVAAKVIADAIGYGQRTIFRLVQEYALAKDLPRVVIDTLIERKIDPAAGKNVKRIKLLLEMPKAETREQAEATVTTVFHGIAERKTSAKPEDLDIEAFCARVVKQFEDRYRTARPIIRDEEVRFVLEMVVNTLRMDIPEMKGYGRPELVPKPAKKGTE